MTRTRDWRRAQLARKKRNTLAKIHDYGRWLSFQVEDRPRTFGKMVSSGLSRSIFQCDCSWCFEGLHHGYLRKETIRRKYLARWWEEMMGDEQWRTLARYPDVHVEPPTH